MVKFLASASLLCIAMILLGRSRGFDISDEGLYVLLADPLQENEAGIFNYDLFFKLLYKIAGFTFSLAELRVIRLLGYVAAAGALGAFCKNVMAREVWSWKVFLLSFLALIVGYAFLPPTLSYNSLATVLICFWLCGVSRERFTTPVLFFLGLVLAILVYVKISLAAVFVPLTFLLLWRRVQLSGWLWFIFPILVFESGFLIALGENAWTRLSLGIPKTSLRPGYQLGLMIKSIAVGGLLTGIPAVMFFFTGRLKKNTDRRFFLCSVLSAAVTFSIVIFSHITDEWSHLVMIFGAAAFGFCFGRYGMGKSHCKWILILLALPYLLHFGSNVYWLNIAVHYFAFWVLAFLLCFEDAKSLCFVAVPFLSVLLVFNGIWWHPFGQEKPLWSAKVPWTRQGNEVLLLDPDLVQLMERIQAQTDPQPSAPIMTAYRIPGLAWLRGSQIPGTPGFWEPSQLGAFGSQPERLLYNRLFPLPPAWRFSKETDLGVYQGDSLVMLWK